MHTEGEEIHVETDEVRGGESRGVMRWVLGISVLVAAALMTVIWVSGALSQGDLEEEATVGGMREDMQDGDNIDSVVGVPDEFAPGGEATPSEAPEMGEDAPDPDSVPEVSTDDN